MIKLRPSGSHIWTNCVAAPLFQSNVPDQPETDETREGTCAAWVAECVLMGVYPDCKSMVGVSHSNGWLVTDEMIDFVEDYIDTLLLRGLKVYAEVKVSLNEFISGTLDAGTIDNPEILFVDDLKFGFGVVEPFENPQLIIYAAGLVRNNNYNHPWVSLGIYQPRAIHPDGVHRTWGISREELLSRADEIIRIGHMCQQPNPVATPGEHCKHCEASGSCVALGNSIYNLVDLIRSEHQVMLTPETIVTELNMLDMAEKLIAARKNGVTTEAAHFINSGQHLRGWGMVSTSAKRKFKYDSEIIEAITGVCATKPAPRTPAEIERNAPNKAQMKRIMKLLTVTPTTTPRLGRVKPSDLERQFRNSTEG